MYLDALPSFIATSWLPIILAAVAVFIASSIIHMVLPYHRSDVKRLPVEKEDALLDAFRRTGVDTGDYAAPHAGSPAGMRDPAFIEKLKRGPHVFFTLAPGREPSMAPMLAAWFVYGLLIAVMAGYVTFRAFGTGRAPAAVFHMIFVLAFLSYGFALPQLSIWYGRSWATTMKSMLDSVIYGVIIAGVFTYLWPK